MEVSESAIAFKHDREPSLNWWVQKVTKERDGLIGKLQVARCRKVRIKFDINIHGNMEAVSIDESNGNTIWQDSIKQ